MPLAESDCAGSGRGFVSSNPIARGKINFVIAVVESIYEPGESGGGEAALLIGPNSLNVCRSAGQDVDPCGKSKCVAEIDDSGIEKLGRAVELHATPDFAGSRDGRSARACRMLARTIQKRETALFQMADEQV